MEDKGKQNPAASKPGFSLTRAPPYNLPRKSSQKLKGKQFSSERNVRHHPYPLGKHVTYQTTSSSPDTQAANLNDEQETVNESFDNTTVKIEPVDISESIESEAVKFEGNAQRSNEDSMLDSAVHTSTAGFSSNKDLANVLEKETGNVEIISENVPTLLTHPTGSTMDLDDNISMKHEVDLDDLEITGVEGGNVIDPGESVETSFVGQSLSTISNAGSHTDTVQQGPCKYCLLYVHTLSFILLQTKLERG